MVWYDWRKFGCRLGSSLSVKMVDFGYRFGCLRTLDGPTCRLVQADFSPWNRWEKKHTSFKLGDFFVERAAIHSMQQSYNIVTVWPCQTKCAKHGVCHNQLKFRPRKLEKPCITKGLATCQSLGVRFSHVTKSLWWTPKQPGASTNHPILLLERLEPWPWPPWPWLRLRRRPWHTTSN